jgi:tartrate dehydratase beta subunit/fumarate hydratase class I family protein
MYEDLDAEAIRELHVKDFYGVVVYDMHGGDLFEANRKGGVK